MIAGIVSSILFVGLILKFLSRTSVVHIFKRLYRSLEDNCSVHQCYRVPKFNDNLQENQLYRRISAYLNSLPSVEDSDYVNLFANSSKSTEINLVLGERKQTIVDGFLGARVLWTIEDDNGAKSLTMKIKKQDKRRILSNYLQHIHQTAEEIELKKKEVKLYVNVRNVGELDGNGRWRSCAFTHPATFETVLMDADLKSRIKSDLENFLKSKSYYHRIGRVWRRSYLLYGPSGTGKSTFIAAMAKFLKYDIYEVSLNNLQNDADLKYLISQTAPKSLLVVEDLERYLNDKSTTEVSLSGILNYMDGIFSGCGEEKVMVFTVNTKENIDASILRPGRVDVHIHFPPCDFAAFKSLANSHLGLKDHKLFPQVEENFATGASLSTAEISEIMVSNRGSPNRALKTVITALQTDLASRVRERLSKSSSGRGKVSEFEKETGQNGGHSVKNLYGLLKSRSSRKDSLDKMEVLDVHERENPISR